MSEDLEKQQFFTEPEEPKEEQKVGKKKQRSISQSELPRVTLEQVVPVAQLMYDNIANGSVTFDELAKLMGKSPNTVSTKYTIWGAEAYGLITKNEENNYILSETGRKIVAPTYDKEDQEGKLKAILTPTLLSKFYTEYNRHPIPQDTYFLNMLESKYSIPRDRIAEAKEIILQNGYFAGVIKKDIKSDKEVINLDQPTLEKDTSEEEFAENYNSFPETKINHEWDKICFVVCPIGDEGSIERKHSDMLLKHLIQPVVESFGIRVVRADRIEKSGLITQQILENLVKARLCVVDMSFNNPNVFYELGVRHMSQLPTIQIIRKGDKIPFDVSHGRTIIIDTSDVYTLIDRLESAKKELAEYIRVLTSNITTEISEDNPIRIYLPGIKVSIPR